MAFRLSRATPYGHVSDIFCTCCPLSGHRWTAFLIPNDRSSFLFTYLTAALNLFCLCYTPFQFYISNLLRLLILTLLLISGNIHTNPGPTDTCPICTRQITRENWSVQCAKCSFWVHLFALNFLFFIFEKFHQDTPELVQVPIFFLNLSISLSNLIFKKFYTYFQNHSKNYSTSIITNSSNLPNYPLLTSTYSPSASSLSATKTLYSSSALFCGMDTILFFRSPFENTNL